MPKVETVKNTNILSYVLESRKIKSIIGTIILSIVGVTLPMLFHAVAGSTAGTIFLPMHIAVLISALTFGTVSATFVAGSSVVFSYLFTGMPTSERLPYMLIELAIYAILLSILNKKFNSYISLIGTIILGRVLYAGVLFVSANLLGFQTYGISVIQSVKIGSIGIIMQLLLIPIIAKVINKGLNLKDE